MKSYDVQIEGLAEAVAAAAPSPKHADLLQAIRRLPGLSDAFLATSGEGGWLQRRQVLTPAGAVVHEDHATWLCEELARDNRRADITAARLTALDLRLSQCGRPRGPRMRRGWPGRARRARLPHLRLWMDVPYGF